LKPSIPYRTPSTHQYPKRCETKPCTSYRTSRHTHAQGKLCKELRTKIPHILPEEIGTGESTTYDSDGSDRKPPLLAVHYMNQLVDNESSCSDDSEIKELSDEAIVAWYGWRQYSNDLWIPARPQPIGKYMLNREWDGRTIGPEPFEGWSGRTPEEVKWDRRQDMMIQEGT
jgi:hypothetical protein